MKRNLSYAQLIEECIDDIDRLYARFGGLRDAARGVEKDAFNDGRGALGSMRTKLLRLRDLINSNGRGKMLLGDWTGEAKLKDE